MLLRPGTLQPFGKPLKARNPDTNINKFRLKSFVNRQLQESGDIGVDAEGIGRNIPAPGHIEFGEADCRIVIGALPRRAGQRPEIQISGGRRGQGRRAG